MASAEEFIAAGLLDPSGDVGNGRLELLQWLAEKGFTIEEMVEANDGEMLGAMAGDRHLRRGTPWATKDVADLVGLGSTDAAALATAFGFGSLDQDGSNRVDLNEQEVATLATFSALAGMFSEEEALGFARVIGASVGRIAEAGVALFLTDVEGPSLAAAENELDLAKNVLAAVELLDEFMPMLDSVLRRHVMQSIKRSRLSIMDEQERLQYRYAVGFIDLVGFTPLSQDMTAADLGVFLRTFEARANDAVTAAGARLVKLIGDEVMFVAPDVDAACKVATALMSEQETVDGRTVVPRGGVAVGPVLVRGGDYFGDVVTTASRLAGQAAPGVLLVTEAFAAAATTLDFTDPTERQLKGFETPVLVRSHSFI